MDLQKPMNNGECSRSGIIWKNGETRRKIGRTKLCSRGHWRPHEDSKLKDLVSQFGAQNWNVIAEKLHARSGKSCRLRWFNQLDPRINKRPFTEEEEERLLAAHNLYGNKWAMIARLFPGRTDNAVKNHYHVATARKRREANAAGVYYRRPRNYGSPNAGNACSEMSSSTTGDNNESFVSTCTDVSLRRHQNLMAGGENLEGPFWFCSVVGNVGHRIKSGNHSDSNSDVVSASEPLLRTCGEEDEKTKTYEGFIDFLGVGPTQ